jgi:hypothetical protein
LEWWSRVQNYRFRFRAQAVGLNRLESRAQAVNLNL